MRRLSNLRARARARFSSAAEIGKRLATKEAPLLVVRVLSESGKSRKRSRESRTNAKARRE